jgi:hypothetical protein
VDAETKPRKIALLGYAPNVRFAPWDDPTVEIWALNDMAFTMPRVDVLFELHSPDIIKKEGHWDRLKGLKIPVLMQEHYDEIPSSVKYPMDAVEKNFMVAGTDRPYLTCSASLMLAVALISDPRPVSIDVYGVDMAQDGEFAKQRPSCEYYLGLARGMGIQISVQHSSDLLKTRFVYGFEDEKLSVFMQQLKERQTFLQNMRSAAAQKKAGAEQEELQYMGACADIDHVIARYGF